MIARWHLDLLAVSVLVGLVTSLPDLVDHLRSRRSEPSARHPFAPLTRSVPPAVILGIALGVAELLGHLTAMPLAALSIAAGVIACRTPAIALVLTGLYVLAPATAGFDLPPWLTALTAVVLLIVLVPAVRTDSDTRTSTDTGTDTDTRPRLTGTDTGSDSDTRPPPTGTDPVPPRASPPRSGSTVVALLVATALWTAAPDTELPLTAIGALLVPAGLDVLRGRIGAPDGPTMATVIIGAAIGFTGRPAGAVVLALIVPPWLTAARVDVLRLRSRSGSPRRRPTTALASARIGLPGVGLALTLVLLAIGCRTGGLRQGLDRSIPPTLLLGGIGLVIAVTVLTATRREPGAPPSDVPAES